MIGAYRGMSVGIEGGVRFRGLRLRRAGETHIGVSSLGPAHAFAGFRRHGDETLNGGLFYGMSMMVRVIDRWCEGRLGVVGVVRWWRGCERMDGSRKWMARTGTLWTMTCNLRGGEAWVKCWNGK